MSTNNGFIIFGWTFSTQIQSLNLTDRKDIKVRSS